MIIKWSLFCEDVQTVDGKGNLIGIIEDFVSPAVPFGIGQLAVVLGTQLTRPISGDIVIAIRLTSTRETVYTSIPTWNNFATEGDKTVFKIVPLFIHNVILPEFGKYTLEILVNGQKVHTNSFRLLQLVTAL